MLVLTLLWAQWLEGFASCVVPWCLLQDTQIFQGATPRSLWEDLVGTCQATGGARESVRADPRPDMRLPLEAHQTEKVGR